MLKRYLYYYPTCTMRLRKRLHTIPNTIRARVLFITTAVVLHMYYKTCSGVTRERKGTQVSIEIIAVWAFIFILSLGLLYWDKGDR